MDRIYTGRKAEHHHSTAMRTVCFSLGLLLLTFCCCDAALAPSNMLATCCTAVTTIQVPPQFIRGITRTNSACVNKAFIIKTVRGKRICYSQTFEWAANVYKKLHNQQ